MHMSSATNSSITKITLDCGMTLLVEPIASAASLALNWLVPLGSATDEPARDGLASMVSEYLFRGCGGRSSRQHSDALDRLGIHRASNVNTHHLQLAATLLGDRLESALPLIVDMIRRPALEEDALEPVRSLCLQAIEGLEDDPQGLVMLRLRERHMASPFNRHGYGSLETVERFTIDDVREAWLRGCVPGGSIFAAAGAVDPAQLAKQLNELLKGWSGSAAEPKQIAPPERGAMHIPFESAQVHIAAAWDAPPEKNPDAMIERLAVGTLSGGTSARLFTEVRQKRALCYSVGASYRSGRDVGYVALYAGTTPERAQETLDVSMAEIHRLREGVSREEFDRAVIGLKSHLIMSGESTAARAGAIAQDEFRLGRARSLDEISRQVDGVSLDQLNGYLAKRDVGSITLVDLGPTALAVGEAVAAI